MADILFKHNGECKHTGLGLQGLGEDIIIHIGIHAGNAVIAGPHEYLVIGRAPGRIPDLWDPYLKGLVFGDI